MSRAKRSWGVYLGVLLSFLLVGAVVAMTVQPVVLDMRMSGRDMSAPIRVENNGPNELPVEVRIVETEFSEDAVGPSNRVSEEIMVFPPQAIIPPGETQVFRLQYVGDPASDRSKHYYAEVSQLPIQLPEGQSAIQILYNFQVMVNVASSTAGAPDLTIEKSEIVEGEDGKRVAAFTVRNSSLNYGYVSSGQLTFVFRTPDGRETGRVALSSSEIQQTIGFGLLGPRMTRRIVTAVEAPTPDSIVEVILNMPRGR